MSKSKNLTKETQREHVKKVVSDEISTAWTNVKKEWSNSTTIIRGPSGYYGNMYPGLDILLEFIKKYGKQTEVLLTEGLLLDNPYIVGYCLVGLDLLKSSCLENIPETVLNREELVTWSVAFVRKTTTLGYFARLYLLSAK